MSKDTFANRLKLALELNNMKSTELAIKTGIDKSLISNYLSGRFKAKQDKVDVMAEVLNVSEGWLMGYDINIERQQNKNIHVDNARYIEISKKTVKIPLLGKVPAGVPIEAIQETLGYEEIPADMIKSGDYFALKVDGDSMYPDYHTGDIIIIRQQPDCVSGDDCVVMVNGDDATFKRVIKHEDSIVLQPLNSNYEPYFFNKEQIESLPVRIIGVAIEVKRIIKK